jgi:hypothetical protein
MPAPTFLTSPDRADLRSRLLAVQFWVGIALAPLAALLLIIGGTAAAAVIAIIAVVVLALSVILRADSDPSARANHVTADEMVALREDVRADITTAARATHRALSEKMSRLEESVAGVQRMAESFAGIRRLEDAIAGVQREVEAARAVAIEARAAVDDQRELPPPPRRPATVVGSVPGVVRHTETVVTRSMYVDRPADDFERPSASTVYGSAARSAPGRAANGGVVNGSTTYGSASRRPDVSTDKDGGDPGRHGSGRHDSGQHGGGRRDAGHDDAGGQDAGRGSARFIDVDAPVPRERELRPDARREEPRGESHSRYEPRGESHGRYEPRPDDRSWREPSGAPSRRELPSYRDDADNRGRGVDRADGYHGDRDDAYHGDRDDADRRDHGEARSHDRDVERDDSHESWTEQRLRAYLPQMREPLTYRSGGLDEHSDTSGDLANDARWSQMRDGDRWAEVRSDDRGRELRMAERREERHVDETGTQMRIVDRWSSVREERIPPAADHTPPRETRAERRRRAEHDESEEMYPAVLPRAELPRPRHAPEDRAERPSGEVGRGWRDVRSGVIEPDHSDRYEAARHDGPSLDGPSRDTSSRGRRPDTASHDSLAHDDVGIYRRRSNDRSASGQSAPDARSDDPYASGWVDDRAGTRRSSRDVPPASRRDSGDFPPARGRDSGDFPPAQRAESIAFEERDDRWVREPGQRSSGRRPQLDFEVTDDRWN